MQQSMLNISKMICKQCHIDKLPDLFPKRGISKKTGEILRRGKCNTCTNEYNKPKIKAAKKKKWRHYQDYRNEYQRNASKMLHYQLMQKRFMTLEEFIFTSRTRLLILKRNIKFKEHENIS